MGFILAIDQGTTSCRAAIINQKGHILKIAQKEFRQYFPKPGWVEHDAEEIWRTQYEAILKVLKDSRINPRDIEAVGITNQRETSVIWDRQTSKPIYPAIVWQDRRTATHCERLKKEGRESFIQARTGLVLDPYFSATKIGWILDHVEGARARAEKGELAFGTMETWLIWNLTGGLTHISDATNASRTLLYNIKKGVWDEELLELFRVPPAILPEIRSSSEKYAETDPQLFDFPLIIAGSAGDQQAALFGQACFEKGQGKVTFGTGCFLLVNTGQDPVFSKHRLLTTVACEIQGKKTFALEGSVFIGGAIVQWLRDELKLIKTSSDIEPLALSVEESHELFFLPTLTGMGAPYWNPLAKGTLFGLTRGTKSGHIARAALEGIAQQVADVIEAMEDDFGTELEALRVDGGATENGLLMRMQSDLTQKSLALSKEKEISALGAGFLAGLAVGYWKDIEEIASLWKGQKVFKPNKEFKKDELRKKWKLAMDFAARFYDAAR